ncbi:MAG: hypothetical protein KZQ64_05385 [gamma proteobacterium symbiont of Bathyaustriella thionipta]|nr:hypothetical protein [gamma proteobacterium symbiont of Bathyaustriella thionipta]MCU7952811.1 hypothetical protein [gamma proteobacterium symbiont of Bathyaustriella thionipta]MCU7957137.1 hypothetical protein [gamma proteobacterium symbiont of Bathyaustriella thionipta]
MTIIFSLFIFIPYGAILASEINLTRSKLVQLALHLEVADNEKQYDFSRLALLEMYNTYQYELERSFTHLPETIKNRSKLRYWRYATQSYLETIPLCQHTCRLKNLVLGDKNGKIYPGI